MLSWVYLAGSIAAAYFFWDTWRDQQETLKALDGFAAAEQLAPFSTLYLGAAIGAVFQGLVASAALQALASITQSLIGIRISSKAAAQAAVTTHA